LNNRAPKASLLFPGVVCATAVALVSAAIVRMLRYRAAWHASDREIERLRGKLIDWAELHFYKDANVALVPSVRPRIVFIGDSITQRWDLPKYFPQFEVINRGIGWQTTSEMLVRFRQDVIDLNPAAVVILGGSNDFATFSGPVLLASTQNNIQSMIELALEHVIVAFVGTIPPIATERLRDQEFEQSGFDSVTRYNDWLRGYCSGNQCHVIDFDHSFREAGNPLSSLLPDGSHPNELGYSLMADAVNSALESPISRIGGSPSSVPQSD